MTQAFSISHSDLVQHLKLSLQVPAVLDAIASRQIIAFTATQFDLCIEPAELQQAADAFRLQHNLVSSETTLAWLQRHRLSVDEFEELIYTDLLASKVANQLFGAQVEPFFQEHRSEYVKAVTYAVVLSDRDLALELFYSLQAQETTFDAIAVQYIDDPSLRRRRGYQGSLRSSEFPKELATSIFAANAPEVLRPIAIDGKHHLVYVEEFIQPELNDVLREKILSDWFSRWLNDQLKQSEISCSL